MNPLDGLHKHFVGRVLTIAESSLDSRRFKAFKRLVLDEYHNELRPKILGILKSDQVRAVPLTDNLDGKEAAMTFDPEG